MAPFSSNAVRLSPREWVVVAAIVSAVFCFGPVLWRHVEKFEPEPDYRLPYQLSNDYWLYERYCRWACLENKTLVIGDSVIWGHYVPKDNTLSHHLNETVGRNQFANLGVDGIHPAALAGLLKYYGSQITGKKVILHFNPLWLSSKKHDLQITKEFRFDHPKLVPQFIPSIPCYKASYSERFSAVIGRIAAFFSWTAHLNKIYFDGMDLPAWTLEHPYLVPKFEIPRQEGAAAAAAADIQWVALDTSLQWRFFQRAIKMLEERANTVFVLVGPFNEHILQGQSINTYRKMKREIETWLKHNNVPYYAPELLPSDLYRDASHPLSEGYALLAKYLFENESFRSSVLQIRNDLGF